MQAAAAVDYVAGELRNLGLEVRPENTAADTLDKIDPQELRENIAVVTVITYALATMTKDLPRRQVALPDWSK